MPKNLVYNLYMPCLRFFVSLLCLAFSTAILSANEPFELTSKQVIAFLGGTNCVNLQNAGYLEATLTLAVDAQPRFVDLAWEGDTVFRQGTIVERWRKAKFGDLAAQLNTNAVTTVFVMFGQNETLSDSTVPEFAEALEQMLSICKQEERQVVIVAPIPFEKTNELLPDLSQRNPDLANYVLEMSRLADKHHCHFVDLFRHFKDNAQNALTNNGLHIRPAMSQLVSNAIATQLNVPTENSDEALRTAISQKHQLWMNYWRPANWKCLYGDDGERNFGKATGDSDTLREEWKQLPNLIAKSEQKIWRLARNLQGERVKSEAQP